jgi:hypothetical protein
MRFDLFRRRFAPIVAGLAVLAFATPTAMSSTDLVAQARPAGAPAHYGSAARPALSPGTRLASWSAGLAHGSSAPAQATNTVWSGSVVHTTSTSVHARWTEPQVTCGAATTFGAIWVGIDGDGSQTVEQTGTQESCSHGHVWVDGWYEMYPKPAVGLPAGHVVEPGNQMRATVAYKGAGAFSLTLRNVSRGWVATEVLSAPNAPRVSAEVVIETPASQAPNLNRFGTVTFTTVTVNHRHLSDWDSSMTRYNLVAGNGTIEDTTSAPSAAGFSVTRNN